MSVNFKAGKYYVGDLCYVINNENWEILGKKTNWFQDDEQFEFKEKTVFFARTAHGDGRFYDRNDYEYSVDAGLIGVIPFDIIDKNEEGRGGQVIEFANDFIVYEEDGKFHIGSIMIDTSEDEDEDDEDDYYEDDEETEEQ